MSHDNIAEFDCPLCGKQVRSVDKQQWSEVRCPHCQQMVQRPTESEAGGGDLDIESHDDVYGIMCHVCDTRIHVTPEQTGGSVECPVCFTQVFVKRPRKKDKVWGRGGATAPETTSGDRNEMVRQMAADPEDDELRLADPVERHEIGAQYGLAPDEPADVESDSSAGDQSQSQTQDDGAELTLEPIADVPPLGADSENNQTDEKSQVESGTPQDSDAAGDDEDLPSLAPVEESRPLPAKSRKSRRERLEAAEQRRQREEERQNRFDFSLESEAVGDMEFPEFNQAALIDGVGAMLRSPGLAWRAVMVTTVMLVGALVKESLFPHGTGMNDFENAGGFIIQGFLASVLGTLPYVVGLVGLWCLAGFVFRDAASGRRQVDSFKTSGRNELLATTLIFAFSFFLAGFLATFVAYLVMPLRMLVAPVFLLAAWYNRSPWAVASVDVFSNFSRLARQWAVCYGWMVLLAVVGWLSGLLFHFRGPTESAALDSALTVVGVILNVIVTLVFAAIAGWHAGRVVHDLNQST